MEQRALWLLPRLRHMLLCMVLPVRRGRPVGRDYWPRHYILFECWMPLLSSSELHRNGMSVHMRVPGTTEGKVWALPRAMRWCLRGLVLSSLLTVAAISRACGTWRPGWSWVGCKPPSLRAICSARTKNGRVLNTHALKRNQSVRIQWVDELD